jgi:hypothetical protein
MATATAMATAMAMATTTATAVEQCMHECESTGTLRYWYFLSTLTYFEVDLILEHQVAPRFLRNSPPLTSRE